jgi:hypothetical protein
MAGWTARRGYSSSAMFLILLFLDGSIAITPGSRVVRPYRHEGNLVVPNNRPVAEAVYRSQFFCPGTIPYSVYRWPERVLQGRDPEDVWPTLRSLCGLYILGGLAIDNAGVYCAYSARAGPFIAFSDDPALGIRREEEESSFWTSVALTCTTRCHCLSDARSDFPSDFKYTLPAPEVAETEAGPTTNLIPNAVTRGYSSKDRNTGQAIEIFVVPMIEIINNPDSIVEVFGASPASNMVAPQCRGTLPPFPLPWPFTTGDVHDVQGLCAAQWFRGSRKGNTGVFCNTETDYVDYNAHTAQ